MVVLLPVCYKDADAALRNLDWIRELDGQVDYHCVVSHDTSFNVNEVLEKAKLAFKTVSECVYPPPKHGGWPGPENKAWQAAALHVLFKLKQPWFWWEQDAVPIKPGWISAIEHDYRQCVQPFMGALCTIKGASHLTGVAVYPPNVPQLSPNMMMATRVPFDAVGDKEVMAKAWITPRIQVNNTRDLETWSKPEDLERIKPETVIYHRCKDASLLNALRASFNQPEPKSLWSRFTFQKLARTTTFFHSGDLGDMIYSMAMAKRFSPIKLLVGPDPNVKVREQMTPQKFEWIAPLLRTQAWIKSIDYCDAVPQVEYDLNRFRKTWFGPGRKSTRLFECYAETFHVPNPPEDVPWLVVDPIVDEEHPIVISRSSRYRNDQFPWKSVSSLYGDRMVFVGHEEEFNEWTRVYGRTADYRPVHDALEMARIIAGASLFIGNQSFPMSLALALNCPLIQEVSPKTPDCIFRRKNAIYFQRGQIEFPKVNHTRRLVTTKPNSRGMIELGPCADAGGLGDTLTITPLVTRLKNSVLCLPPSMANLAPLFTNLCPVAFTDNYPVFKHVGGVHMAKSKLQLFGLDTSEFLPVVRITDSEHQWALNELAAIKNPVAFVPSCSATWQHIRSRPPEFFEPFVAELSKRFTVLQFGRLETPLIKGCERAKFYSVRQLASIYSVIGSYFGVDTGDYHLMLAVGGKCMVAVPESVEGYCPVEWSYPNCQRAKYVSFNNPQGILKGLEFL